MRRALQQLALAGLDEVVVVTGAYHASVKPEVDSLAHEFPPGWLQEVFNPDFEQGLLGSIQAGLRSCDRQTDAVLITLVDLPFLEAGDFAGILQCFRKGRAERLVRSVADGKPTHPVLIPRAYFPEILQKAPSERGCSFLFEAYADRVRTHEVTQDNGHIDIDTMEDYLAHISP